LSWKSITGNQIPTNGIIGGFDTDKSTLYICRHSNNSTNIPGNASLKSGCYVTDAGKVINLTTDYEILIGDNYDWVPRHGGDPVPKNAFVAGTDIKGMPTYIGRCDLHLGSADTRVIGKIQHKFFYAMSNTEHSDTKCNNHEIMVC